MTSTQLDRKRELDRAAQRHSRARTRNHIDYLESLVNSLRADSDDRVADLLQQLDEKQAEIQRLRGVLNNIGKQLAVVEKETPEDEAGGEEEAAFGSDKRDVQIMSPMSPMSPDLGIAADRPPIEEGAQTFAVNEPRESTISIPKLPPELPPTDPSAPSLPSFPHPQYQSITQLASSITQKTNLEGRLW